jgi:hypothetical protein
VALPGDALQPEPVELWPEHEEALRVFAAMLTQWRMGYNGPVGLDYAVLPIVERRLGLRPCKQRFADLQVLEAEALRWFAQKQG